MNHGKRGPFDYLVGGCEVHIDGRMTGRSRCWLDLESMKFAVEIPNQVAGAADEDKLTFRKLVFPTQTGELSADELRVSFASSKPSMDGSSMRDGHIARSLDFVSIAPIWRFTCNESIFFDAADSGDEVFLRPGKEVFSPVDLACGGRLIGADFGICVRNSPNFGPENHTALEMALGCPLSESARLKNSRLELRLNSWAEVGNFRRFHDAASNGYTDPKKDAAGIAEIYRAALEFQKKQSDGGKGFRLAVDAFLESRSKSIGYTLSILAVMHMLEWLDGNKSITIGALTKYLNITENVAKAIMILRNEISHNHHDLQKNTDLATCIEKACRSIGVELDLGKFGFGSQEVGLLNFLFSLVGRMLLDKVEAQVEPVLFIPGHGRFEC